MGQTFIHFKSKVIRFIDNKRKVLIVKVLCLNLSTTLVGAHRDFRLFDDTNGITLGADFTEINYVM